MSVRTDQVNMNVTINGERAGSTLNDLRRKSRELKNELSKLPVESEAFRKKMAELNTVNKTLGGITKELRGLNSAWGDIKKTFAGFTLAEVTMQAAGAIKNFAKDSVAAYNEAAQAEAQLLNALNGQQDVQQRLIEQAKQLQKSTIYQDDAIVAAQTYLAAQQLTEEQILKTMRAAVQLATVTGTDLQTATEQLAGTYEGVTGKMGKLDSRIKDFTKTELENGAVVDLINEKYQGFAETAGEAGTGPLTQLTNVINDLEEVIGELLVKWILPGAQMLKTFVVNLTSMLTTTKDQKTATENLIAQFNLEMNTLQRGNFTHEERKKLINDINTKYGEYLPNLISENDALEDIARAQTQVNKLLMGKIFLEHYQKDINENLEKQLSAEEALLEVKKAQVNNNPLLDEFQQNKVNTQLENFIKMNELAGKSAEENTAKIEDKYRKMAESMGLNWDDLKATLMGGLASNDVVTANKTGTDKLLSNHEKYQNLLIENMAEGADKERAILLTKYKKELEDYGLHFDNLQNLSEEEQLIVSELSVKYGKELRKIQEKGEMDRLQVKQDAADESVNITKAEKSAEQQVHLKFTEWYTLNEEMVRDITYASLDVVASVADVWRLHYESIADNENYSREERIRAAKHLKAIKLAEAGIMLAATLLMDGLSGNWIKFAKDAALGAIQISTISATPIPKYARGRITDGPEIAQIGEDGVEAVIPLTPKYRAQAMPIFAEAASALGFNMAGQQPQAIAGSGAPSGTGATDKMLMKMLYKMERTIDNLNNSIGSGVPAYLDFDRFERDLKKVERLRAEG